MLFTDDTPSPPDSVASATRSSAAKRKASDARISPSLAAYSVTDLIAELATLTRNQLRIGQSERTFPRLSKPNPIQAKALQLVDIKLTT